jgi:hypothetical protein
VVSDADIESRPSIGGRGPAYRANVLVIDGLTAKDADSFTQSMGPLGWAVGSAVAGPGDHGRVQPVIATA